MQHIANGMLFPNTGSEFEKIAFLIKLLDLKGDTSKITLKTMAGGITNSVYMLKTPTKKSIVRIYGNNTEQIIDRVSEQANIRKANLIKIYASFDNGMVCSFQEGRTIDVPMMSDPLISDKLARKLALLHKSTYFENNTKNIVFDRILNFINKTNPEFEKNGKKVDIEALLHTFSILKNEITALMRNRPLALTHNDLLSGNILWDGEDVGFVDYEYSGYTWPEYDIANHFLEWCGFELDLTRFPSYQQQICFIKIYLTNLYGKEPEQKEVEQWQTRVDKLVHLSHLFWGSWAFFQAANSSVNFPYFEYGLWRIKLINFNLPLKEGHPLLKNQLVTVN